MENNAELVRLEEFVDKLLGKYNQLKADYQALQNSVKERESECSELKTNLTELTAERTEVGNRVAGLIDRIEQWEFDQEILEEEKEKERAAQGEGSGDAFQYENGPGTF